MATYTKRFDAGKYLQVDVETKDKDNQQPGSLKLTITPYDASENRMSNPGKELTPEMRVVWKDIVRTVGEATKSKLLYPGIGAGMPDDCPQTATFQPAEAMAEVAARVDTALVVDLKLTKLDERKMAMNALEETIVRYLERNILPAAEKRDLLRRLSETWEPKHSAGESR